jgi:hypothetical protein
MAWIATAIVGAGALGAGASIFGASEQAGAEKAAAGTISSSTQQAIQSLLGLVNQGTTQIGNYTTQGLGALSNYTQQAVSGAQSTLSPLTKNIPQLEKTLTGLLTPGTASSVLQQLPGYQFLLNTGITWGVDNAATTSGLGGNVLTAANNYAQGVASTSWGTLVGQLQNLLNTGATSANNLAGLTTGALTGAGQSAAGLLGGAGQSIGSLLGNAGQQISGLTGTAGQNIAQTQVGSANAIAGGATGAASALGGIGSSLSNISLLNALTGGKILGSGGLFGASNTPSALPSGGAALAE